MLGRRQFVSSLSFSLVVSVAAALVGCGPGSDVKHATLKQFHDAFIAQGALPIPLVRRILLR